MASTEHKAPEEDTDCLICCEPFTAENYVEYRVSTRVQLDAGSLLFSAQEVFAKVLRLLTLAATMRAARGKHRQTRAEDRSSLCELPVRWRMSVII
jgi:hypothetical protein